jgi:transcription-repair coupling factor (superfamily II helicase)
LIVEAIENEIERGGQVFFVSDKVDDLEKIMSDLKMLLPHLKFGLAHGQMKPSELEKVMEQFISGKFQVLVATKIIESGIDIPNANTMLINRAQNFGLAELYQLRGRVGRTNKQAYCYLLIPESRKLTEKALRRLQAVEEFTDLGSGFKLAMRDMEIRGAGNLLGAEQSGFIIDIGFEMFNKILNEAVQELKEEEFSDLFGSKEETISFENEDVAIEIDSDALIPNDYIRNGTERFNYYRKLYNVKNNSKLDEIRKEIVDKFGKMPEELINLIYVIKLRVSAISSGFTRVSVKSDKMVCEFPPETNEKYYQIAFPQLIDYIREIEGAKLDQTKNKLFLEVDLDSKDKAVEVLWKFKRTMELMD